MTSRACSTEYRLKHPCGKAAGVLCRIRTVLVLLCRGGRLCPPCMHAPYHPVGDGVLDVPHRRGTMPTSSRPCHSEPVRAAKQVPLGYTLAWESVSLVRRGEGAAALRHNVPSQIRVEKIAKSAILHKFRAECWLMCRNSENCVKSLANDMQRWYTCTIHRKYTIYRHPWVSCFAAFGGKADSVFTKSKFTWEGS